MAGGTREARLAAQLLGRTELNVSALSSASLLMRKDTGVQLHMNERIALHQLDVGGPAYHGLSVRITLICVCDPVAPPATQCHH